MMHDVIDSLSMMIYMLQHGDHSKYVIGITHATYYYDAVHSTQ